MKAILTSSILVAAAGAALAADPLVQKRPLAPATMPANPTVALQRGALPVTVDAAMLVGLRPDEPLLLDVAANQQLPALVQRVEPRGAGRFSVFGRLADDPDSSFIIVVHDDAAVGIVEAPARRARYKLGYLASGVGQIAPIDPAEQLECGLRPDPNAPAAPAAGPQPHDAPADDEHAEEGMDGGIAGGCPAPPENFDVIIIYTTNAMNEAGSRSAIQAQAQLAVDQANQAYDDSRIDPRMTLVWTRETTYNESADIYDDRDRLADPNDGFMDSVHADRDAFGADFVCLFVANVNNNNAAGLAFCTPSGPEEGFCVVLQSQAVSNISFAHEIGHLQGCAHDFANAGVGCNETCYAYGRRFFGDSGQGWRTVMAYDNNNNDYVRIGRFSNPNVFFDGEPTGNDNNPCIINENNARLINETALSRESWRAPRFDVWVELAPPPPFAGTHRFPWPTVAAGVAAMYDDARTPLVQPTLNVKAGAYDEQLTISTPMTIRACGGSAIIGN